jgi:hypothetical protein
VPSLPESASIRPLNPPHRSFVLELDVLHLCCRRPGLPRPSGGSGRGRRGAAADLGVAGRAAADLGASSRAVAGLGAVGRSFAGLDATGLGIAGLGAVGLFPSSSDECSALGAAGLGAPSSASRPRRFVSLYSLLVAVALSSASPVAAGLVVSWIHFHCTPEPVCELIHSFPLY